MYNLSCLKIIFFIKYNRKTNFDSSFVLFQKLIDDPDISKSVAKLPNIALTHQFSTSTSGRGRVSEHHTDVDNLHLHLQDKTT